MDEKFIFNLKLPCKNRGVELKDNKNGSVDLNGTTFWTMRECEDYLESKPRTDI